jgi:hypothetical protein
MSYAGLLTTPCTLIRRSPGAPDVYNDQQLVETSESSSCAFEIKRTRELSDSGLVEISLVTVFLPPDVAMSAIDAVQIAGGPLVEADGTPHVVVNARTGRVHHVELTGKEAV